MAIRQFVKKLLQRCVTCRKVNGTSFNSSDLALFPAVRVKETTPFAVTGADFARPLFAETYLKKEKTHTCLFACAVTRACAVHLEILSNLSEEKFLLAVRRFSFQPYISTTYLASAQTLRELFEFLSLKETFSWQGV